MVSGELTLDPGSYALSAKLHLTAPSILPPSPFNVTCVLDGEQQPQELDRTRTTVAGPDVGASLASTVEVHGSPRKFFVSCVADSGNDATAENIQLIAIRVDSVSAAVVP